MINEYTIYYTPEYRQAIEDRAVGKLIYKCYLLLNKKLTMLHYSLRSCGSIIFIFAFIL